MRTVLGLVLMIWCAPALAQGVTATPDLGSMRTAGVDVVALVGERFKETLALLQKEFPTDYATLTVDLAAIDRMTGEENALLVVAFKRLTELRRKYAPRLRFAPTLAHAAMVGHLAVLYDQVFREEGPEVCGRFARDGTAALIELGLSAKYARAIDQQSFAYFEAVVSAIETPEPSEPVRPRDWESILRRMIDAGAPASFAATISAGDPHDPDLCPALAALLVTISAMNSPEGARARADFAQNLAGY